MTRPRFARIACCVPFCRRGTTLWPSGEFMCGKHYRLADKELRRRRSKVIRRLRLAGEMDGDTYKTDRAWRIDTKLWNKIKGQAIERAAASPLA